VTVLEFFYDFSSPFAYLGATQVERLAEGHTLVWRPFLLGALFKTIGTPLVPLETFAPAKLALVNKDQYRWAEHWGVDFNFPSRFPQRSVKALRVALAVPDEHIGRVSLAIYRTMWVDDGELEDVPTLTRTLETLGLDATAVLAASETEAVKQRLRENTDRAVALGLCGAPSYVINDVVYWGQDRQEFVKKALAGWVPKHERG
jgi:2-hydroxychromene-2-carboxylate isomerase